MRKLERHPLISGSTSYLDLQVGIVMEKIRELGLENNTIIMFSSKEEHEESPVTAWQFVK